MKKILITATIFISAICSYAQQGLQGINYQAVARNLNGTVLDNKAVQVRFTITQGNTNTIQYQETHTTTTNAYGLFNLVIGKGTATAGTFTGIPFKDANQWLQVEVSVSGGALTSIGKSAFQSVPFAQMALQASPVGNAGGDLIGSTYPNPIVAPLTITNGKVADNAITTTKIADANVTTSKLADGAITQIKIAPGVTLPPGGTATGDLSGTYPAPTVAKIQGMDVSNAAPTNGQALVYNTAANKWEPNSNVGGSNLWIKAGTNLYTATLTDYVGVGLATNAAKLYVKGQGAVNYSDVNGSYGKAGIVADNSVVNTVNFNTGIIANSSNGRFGNNGLLATTTKNTSGTEPNQYIGMMADNFTNNLNTTALVIGSSNLALNAGTGNSMGSDNEAEADGDGDVTGSFHFAISGGTGTTTGSNIDAEAYGDGDVFGIFNQSYCDIGNGNVYGIDNYASSAGKGLVIGNRTKARSRGSGLLAGQTITVQRVNAANNIYSLGLAINAETNGSEEINGILNNVTSSGTGNVTGSKTLITNQTGGTGDIIGNDITTQGINSTNISSVTGAKNFVYDMGKGEVVGNEIIVDKSGLTTTGNIYGMRMNINSNAAPTPGNYGNTTGIGVYAKGNGTFTYGINATANATDAPPDAVTVGGEFAALNFNNHFPGRVFGIKSTAISGDVSAVNSGPSYYATNPAGYFISHGGQGIFGEATTGSRYLDWGNASVAIGVSGNAINPNPGFTDINIGVLATAANSNGSNFGSYNIITKTTDHNVYQNFAIYGVNKNNGNADYAGVFDCKVFVTQNLTAFSFNSPSKAFKIDNPLHPTDEYLMHSCVESPDMMNIYNGNITTDADGNATITLPEYFEALNKDFRYQLTVIGSFAQAMVAKKVNQNKFSIKTNQPNTEVSWQVTGIRHDAMADKYRIQNVIVKEGAEKGKYLYPEGYGITDDALSIHPKNIEGNENFNKKITSNTITPVEERKIPVIAKPVVNAEITALLTSDSKKMQEMKNVKKATQLKENNKAESGIILKNIKEENKSQN